MAASLVAGTPLGWSVRYETASVTLTVNVNTTIEATTIVFVLTDIGRGVQVINIDKMKPTTIGTATMPTSPGVTNLIVAPHGNLSGPDPDRPAGREHEKR